MKGLLTERNIVVVLFILVLITFSLAQSETKKMEQLYNGGQTAIKFLQTHQPEQASIGSLSSAVN
jgi:hypothetical protein